MKQMSFMAKQIGSHFEGVITGVTSYGFFVRIDRMGVEGMVRMSTIDDDYYHFDEQHYRIIGRRNGKIYQLGDKIKVGVMKVDKTASEMDLYIVIDEKQKKSKSKSKPKSKKETGKKKQAVKRKRKRS